MNKKVFISYRHRSHQNEKDNLERTIVRSGNINNSVEIGEIAENLPTDTIYRIIRDEYLRDTQVTIVLLDEHTKHRKHIDREIASSLRNTNFNPRNGLLVLYMDDTTAIKLSSNTFHSAFSLSYNNSYIEVAGPRIGKNIKNGYAVTECYKNVINNPARLNELIELSISRKNNLLPDNSEEYRKNNTPCLYCGKNL